MVTYPSKKRYDKENILRVAVGFNRRTEPELVERVEEEENKAAYIRSLVREDVERRKSEEK